MMIVETDELCMRYGRVETLKRINLNVPEGSAFALVGTNGAGKTTTMRLLMNILQPTSGSARVLGCDTRNLKPSHFQKVGYVSENQVLPERLTIAQYFDYLRALYPNWDRGLENSLRKRMQLPSSRPLSKLSHGMRMKTVLIAGLAFRPKLLVLDEPLSGMDTLTRDEVIDGLLEQADETTILISSHELAEIENFTTDIAFMDDGNLIFQESIETTRDRYREVHVTLSAQKTWPVAAPEYWMGHRIQGHTQQFIDSNYQGHESLISQLNACFGAVQCREVPMSLREISKVLIRESRDKKQGAMA